MDSTTLPDPLTLLENELRLGLGVVLFVGA